MAGDAGLARRGVPVTAEAGSRIDPGVDPVPGKVVAAMLHPPIVFGLIFNGRFEFRAGHVTVVAETLFVAAGTDLFVLVGRQAVRISKSEVVVVFSKGYGLSGFAVALDAEHPSFAQLEEGGVFRWQVSLPQ